MTLDIPRSDLVGVVEQASLPVVEGLERLVLALLTLPVVAAGHVTLLWWYEDLDKLSKVICICFIRRPLVR